MESLTRRILAFGALLLAPLTACEVQAQEAVAIVGQPWGIARVTVPFRRADFGNPIESRAFSIADDEGRVFYPVFKPKRFLPILQSLMGADQVTPPQELDVYFLFRGDTPFEIAIQTPTPQLVRITPTQRRPAPYNNLLRRWWQTHHEVFRERNQASDLSPVLETYLSMMLSERIGVAPPPLSQKDLADRSPLDPNQSLLLLMGTEKVHDAMLKAIMQNEIEVEQPLGQVRPPIPWDELPVPEPAQGVEIEAIAAQVPEECFYVRFGSLGNYLWLNRLLERNGGDLSRMISNRRVAVHLNETVQRQLALKQSELAEIFGDRVVQDVALIGRDTYTREGAALGMLFHARNNDLLANDFNRNRQAALREFKAQGAKLETVQLLGQDVSFLSTPDNTLRSFYIRRGDFHLVTTSRSIAESFLALEEHPRSLANSREFQYARTLMPIDRDDTVFIYLSSQFFRGLYSPQYRVELRRRLQSVVEMELQQLAQAAASNEGFEDTSVENLIDLGFLPTNFGLRADGSRLIASGDTLGDSLRGGRGHFLPIADVDIQGMTRQEAADFDRLRQFHSTQWRQMNPILVGINRFKLNDEGLERIAIDARISPFQRANYQQYLSFLGPPSRRHIATGPQDVVAIQAVLSGQYADEITNYGVAVQDLPFPLTDFTNQGFLNTLRMIRATPGYLTAWPNPGIIDRIPFLGPGAVPDEFGYSELPFGLWRREWNGFSTLSFYPDILANVTPNLALVEDEHPAQIRVHIGDISDARITPLANNLAQGWAKVGSMANAAFFHEIHNQLGVAQPQAKAFSEQLLNLEFVDPLGGTFEYVEQPDLGGRWVSSSWTQDGQEFQANLMTWFRGLDARLNVDERLVEFHAQIDMQNEKPQPGLRLPSFDFFGAFGGSSGEKAADKAAETSQAPKPPEELPKPERAPDDTPKGVQF